jgi:murein DD-endopeptidase MepM/ murein hydrolase activator NlpD
VPGVILLGVFGVWLLSQATIGRLAARLLSYRDVRPGEVPAPAPAAAVAGGAIAGGIAGAITTWQWPVHGPVTGRFGEPRGGRTHKGLDIAVPTGTPVAAARTGKVIGARWNDGFGNWVQIDHGDGLTSSYAHLSRIDVHAGQQVGTGATVGLVGSTGDSTGPHLHLEIARGGTTVDPGTVIGGAP